MKTETLEYKGYWIEVQEEESGNLNAVVKDGSGVARIQSDVTMDDMNGMIGYGMEFVDKWITMPESTRKRILEQSKKDQMQ